jgi:dienelactone hydrolase
VAIISFGAGLIINLTSINRNKKTEIQKTTQKPLEKYEVESLSKTKINPGEIHIDKQVKDEAKYSSYLFSLTFDPSLDSKTTKKTTGQINIPKSSNPSLPLIIMLRGYVDQKLYKTGDGTRRAGEYFAENGFITIAPDFLGYAKSDPEAENILETRFQTYTTTLSLLNAIESLKHTPKIISGPSQLVNQLTDHSTIFIWAHSNGGQIALTVLEITGANYPTTLWAPVSKPFPYSILYYTDEAEDRGKLIRKELAKFEAIYDVEKYSFDNYLEKITAPLQIHQGANDDAVPKVWSDRLVQTLNNLGKDVVYHVHRKADHNMYPNWNEVIKKDLEFFRNHF